MPDASHEGAEEKPPAHVEDPSRPEDWSLSPGGYRLLRRFARRVVATVLGSLAVAAVVFSFLWLNPKGLTDAAQYALVQPMVETLIGTAFDVSVFVVTTVLALALILITYRTGRKSTAAVENELRLGLVGLILPAGAAVMTIMASFLFRVWVGYASFDWVGPYLEVAVPMIALLIFSMLAQLILLVFAALDVLRQLLTGPIASATG